MSEKKQNNYVVKRYIIFLIGLFVNSLGVALITKANLGTSPISSIPYVLSLNYPFTLGNFTIFFSILLIVLQLILLGKNFKVEHLLQIPVSLIFGYFIDFCMILLGFVNPEAYPVKVVDLLIGCLILGVGVYMEVLADVVMLPGESFVRAVVFRWKTEFGVTKICFDVSMAVIAAVLSFVLAGRLDGVREGTVVAALLVGFIARTIGRYLSFMPEKLFGSVEDAEAASGIVENGQESTAENITGMTEAVSTSAVREEDNTGKHFCIAIGRQYGSGGRDLGAKLAEKLNCEFYDKEIIQLAAGSTGYTPEYISKREENMTNSLLYDLVHEMYAYSDEYEPPKDKIFEAETEVIRSAAEKGNCVIVGRCADAILKDDPDCVRVFLSAPLKTRIQTVMKRDGLDEKAAKHKIAQTDHRRADNYRYYTRRVWGMSGNYQMCIDTSLGEEYVINTVMDLVKNVNADRSVR